jgi:hypothetical protein
MLCHHARAKGYKDGWAWHKYREAFREQPGPEVTRAPPQPPDEAVLSWLLSQTIRYVKSKARRAA